MEEMLQQRDRLFKAGQLSSLELSQSQFDLYRARSEAAKLQAELTKLVGRVPGQPAHAAATNSPAQNDSVWVDLSASYFDVRQYSRGHTCKTQTRSIGRRRHFSNPVTFGLTPAWIGTTPINTGRYIPRHLLFITPTPDQLVNRRKAQGRVGTSAEDRQGNQGVIGARHAELLEAARSSRRAHAGDAEPQSHDQRNRHRSDGRRVAARSVAGGGARLARSCGSSFAIQPALVTTADHTPDGMLLSQFLRQAKMPEVKLKEEKKDEKPEDNRD